MSEPLLNWYFQSLLRAVSHLPPPFSYWVLPISGHLFRDWTNYTCATGRPGILLKGVENLQRYLKITPQKAASLMRDHLRFESRYVLENFWISRQDKGKIKKAFLPQSHHEIHRLMPERQCIICTLHSSNMFLMAALFEILFGKISIMLSIIPDKAIEEGSPTHRSGVNMVYNWKKWQELTPASIEAARQTLERGFSLIMACDTPPHNNRGKSISMWGRSFRMPTGAVRLAQEFNLPLLILIPWAPTCTAPYKIEGKMIDATRTIEGAMMEIFEFAQKTILLNPSCWLGWLYLSKLEIVKE